MTRSFKTESGELVARDGSRVVFTTAGIPIVLLPAAHDLALGPIAVNYPDAPKDNFITYHNKYVSLGNSRQESAQSGITATPQQWNAGYILAAMPPKCDHLLVSALLQRTAAPSHDWGYEPLIVRPPQNAWIPMPGSMLLEAAAGISRLLHVYPSGGNVILELDQSVSVAPSGYGTRTVTTAEFWNVSCAVTEGLPVYMPTGAPYFTSGIYTGTGNTHGRGRPGQPSLADPTNYASSYALSLRLRFGRRS